MRSPAVPRLLVAMALLWGGGIAAAQYSEADVKAALVYNIAKFVAWPADAVSGDGPIGVCYLGAASELAAALTVLQGRTLAGRPIEVRQAARAAALGRCQVVVVGADVAAEGWQAANRPGVLTIGEGGAFADAGGMVTLARRDERMQFDINLDSTRRAGLTLSAQLLRLAARVKGQQ